MPLLMRKRGSGRRRLVRRIAFHISCTGIRMKSRNPSHRRGRPGCSQAEAHTQIDLPPFNIAMWKSGEMEALMRPNPYSSSIIDKCGKWGFGTLFLGFLRFFQNFCIVQGVQVHFARPERQRKSTCSHSEMASKGLQMPSVMGLVGSRKRKYDAENPGVTDDGIRGVATGAGHGIPSRRARWEEADSCRAAHCGYNDRQKQPCPGENPDRAVLCNVMVKAVAPPALPAPAAGQAAPSPPWVWDAPGRRLAPAAAALP